MLFPRCIHTDQEITLSSLGFFTPCCWVDDELYKDHPAIIALWNEHLHLDNNEDIQDIFDSEEWKNLWDILINSPDNAPRVCKKYCGNSLGETQVEILDDGNQIINKH
tara:strand:- start:4180 stop:4503 length:324 start_codon:yes stop_codon:yes gene_type:complete